MTTYLKLCLIGCIAALSCCKPAQAPTVHSVRADLRAATSLAKDAWVIAGQICVDTAEATKDDSIRDKCSKVLIPAHDKIVDAAKAVDALAPDGDSNNVVCILSDVSSALESVPALLGPNGHSVSTVTDLVVYLSHFEKCSK
jgi:hypothetical protein